MALQATYVKEVQKPKDASDKPNEDELEYEIVNKPTFLAEDEKTPKASVPVPAKDQDKDKDKDHDKTKARPELEAEETQAIINRIREPGDLSLPCRLCFSAGKEVAGVLELTHFLLMFSPTSESSNAWIVAEVSSDIDMVRTMATTRSMCAVLTSATFRRYMVSLCLNKRRGQRWNIANCSACAVYMAQRTVRK